MHEHVAHGLAQNQVAASEEEVVSLVGRAVARCRFPDLNFTDPCAEQVVGSLDLDVARYDERRLRASVVRTMVIDGIVSGFAAENPDGIVVSVHGGLCTRFARLDNGTLQWVELDPPPVAAFKHEVWGARDRLALAASCSLACCRWMSCATHAGAVPILLVLEGAVRRARLRDVETFLSAAVERMPVGTQLVVDYDARVPLRPSRLPVESACLEMTCESGDVARFPRLRFVGREAYEPSLERALEGVNGVSRLFQGRAPSIAHLSFA